MSLEGIVLEDNLFDGKYDESNALILPGTKSKSKEKVKKLKEKKKKLLTKKQRKTLERIVKRRDDKKQRVELLEQLKEHALPAEVLKSFTTVVNARQHQKPVRMRKRLEKIIDSSNQSFSGSPAESIHDDNQELSPASVEQDYCEEAKEVKPRTSTASKSKVLKNDVETNSSKSDGANSKCSNDNIRSMDKKLGSETTPADHNPIEIIDTRKLHNILPNRLPEIQNGRLKLPIIGEEQVIMEAIRENLVVVIAGETGSGKTTQVPQFLYEAGYAGEGKIIGVTEPRRIAAIAMSNRVATELNVPGSVVSYQIRFEGNATDETKIKFMTDGVLLKEMETDILLSKYSVICIDEAHERTLYTDIVIGLLSRTINVRLKRKDPLRLVIMSATMRVQDFTDNKILFKIPPKLIHIPVRQFPVHQHFARRTPQDYMTVALSKVRKIHKELPEGGILVFVTGKEEVISLVASINSMFPPLEEETRKRKAQGKAGHGGSLARRDKSDSFAKDEDSEDLDAEVELNKPILAIPLYSMLSRRDQEKVFHPPPTGTRLCVVATNVAETSLTIPGIRYVVDCGKEKLKRWDTKTGVQKYEVAWCSKASADQRSGRAGRTGPGHCYRLFSSAVFDSQFSEYAVPEIANHPVDQMVLGMKYMSINNVRTFPYPTHPGNDQIVAAENLLILLGALEIPEDLGAKPGIVDKSRITPLGKTMTHLPVSPRFSRMLALGFPYDVLEYVITLVAALTVPEVLIDLRFDSENGEDNGKLKLQSIRRRWGGTGSSLLLGDCMVLLKAVGAFEYGNGTRECANELGLNYKSMLEIRKLRRKIFSDLNETREITQPFSILMPPLTPEKCDLLRQIVLSGCPDRIAKAIDPDEITTDMKKMKHPYWCGELEEPVFIHNSSVLRGQYPEWIVYQESFEFNGKIFLKGVTAVDKSWIPHLCPALFAPGNAFRFRSNFSK